MQFVISNILPISIAFFSGIMLLWSFFGNRFRGIKEVDSSAALQLINHKDAVVLDVRERSEYDAGHVLNSKFIPLGKLRERMGELVARLEAGEDPESLEHEMDDGGGDDFDDFFKLKNALQERRRKPRVDDELFFL